MPDGERYSIQSMGFFQRLRMWFTCLKTRRRPIGAHIATEKGMSHHSDTIPNQDAAFALIEGIFNATTTATATRRTTTPRPNASTLIVAGVFDGHGLDGHLVSKLMADTTEEVLTDLLVDSPASAQDAPLPMLLSATFQHAEEAARHAPCCVRSGTTASLIVIRDDDVHLAWVGDSVVIIVTDARGTSPARIRFVSPMHRAGNLDEALRIESVGGQIIDGYVVDDHAKNGIAVTRTMGDVDMRQQGCISEAQMARLKLEREDAVVVLASDGLWDTPALTSEVVIRIAARKRGRCAKRICKQLMDFVIAANGPADDCTIVCITLR